MLATTQTSEYARPTTTARLRSNSPPAFGASDHSARFRRGWPAAMPNTRKVIDRAGRCGRLRAFSLTSRRGALTNVSQTTDSCGRSYGRGTCTRTQPVVLPRV
jgi:hypothetical protein